CLLDGRLVAAPLGVLAAALTSHRLGHGHVCLDLAATLDSPDLSLSLPPEGQQAGRDVVLPSDLLQGVGADHWCRQLAASPLVEAQAADQGERALVLQGRRLDLRRYWRYERQVASILRQRLATRLPLPQGLPEQLQRLFADSTQQPDWQRLACALAARGAFSIITGGPGTGKTTTVVRLLALLQAPA